jgi:hypothetical protein
MKARSIVVAAALCTFGILAVSKAASLRVSKPMLGTWTLNVAKSKFEGVPAPKSQTRVYEDWGGGIVHARFEGIDADGKPTLTEFAARYDGRDYPRVVRGSQTAGTIALKRIDDLRTDFTQKEDGRVTITGTRIISPDRKTTTITYKGTNVQGAAVSATLVLDKQ